MTTYRIGQERRTRPTAPSIDSALTTTSAVYDGKLHALAPDQVHTDGDRIGTAVCGARVQLSLGEQEFDPTMMVDVGVCQKCRRKATTR